MKKTVRLLAMVMTVCMLLNTAVFAADVETTAGSVSVDTAEQLYESVQSAASETGSYNEGVVLVKSEKNLTLDMLAELDAVSAEPLYRGSAWYTVTLGETVTTAEAVDYLRELDCFDAVDYDYIMKADGEVQSVDISGNTYAENLTYLDTLGVKKGWESNLSNGKAPGGSPGVVVAVIDTGVDYNHLDLRNNIWTNPAEIPDNGIDDDGNGYVDDIHGWNCVGDNNDPMDDNGHGTHVAGIIAAENNKIGTVGVAFNCKIMVVKAGNSSGYFNNSDIAEAVQYAYMNGASVINMSFGGSSISIAVEEAIENAYTTSILVAAAGNDGKCNQPGCPDHISQPSTPFYPASLTYVIGVMSCDASGTKRSEFSNFDHSPYQFNKFEYEVYACGESIPSTWPNNKYASLSGTSMACPTVAGIAALLRSQYSDRGVYSTKFIQSQIVNTGDSYPDGEHAVVDAYNALTMLPKPAVNLYDYYIDDSASINSANNGNGVIDAGETVRLYISLHNRGGVASNVNVSIDTYRSTVGDEALTDPYFTFVNSSIQLSDIGTYSVRECYEDQYFEIIVSPDCPNDYLVDFNIRYTYTNGLDEKDSTTYSGDGVARFNVSRGYHLPSVITEDTVFTDDRLYIVGQDVVIPAGVTVTFEEGCEIQFYDDREYYNSPVLTVYGTLNIAGTKDNMVTIAPNERNANFICKIEVNEGGSTFINYVDCINCKISFSIAMDVYDVFKSNIIIENSFLKTDMEYFGPYGRMYTYESGGVSPASALWISGTHISGSYITNAGIRACEFYSNYIIDSGIDFHSGLGSYEQTDGSIIEGGKLINNIIDSSNVGCAYCDQVENNIFLTSNSKDVKDFVQISGYHSNYRTFSNNQFAEYFKSYASQLISNYTDTNGNPTIDIYSSLADPSLLWPYVVNVEMFDKDGNPITTVGKEEITVRVTFNRPMDTTQDTSLTFGTIEPYADYRINGEWISDTVWEGTYTLKAQIENGQNYLKVNNACAAEDPTKTVFGEYMLHEFNIDTTAAMSMNLQANPTEDGINLTFAQDDYDTLLGYNIYRADSKDGNYVKLNPAILLPTDETFLDSNAEPGKTYWYTYTVVLTDFSESNPAGRVVATAMDTIAPNMYHTPVNQGYMNNNLVISCTASDNVAISNVTLYYRTVGAARWKTLTMAKQSDRYSAAILCDEITLDGIEYYIVASDGINTIAKGSADAPYTVVIKDASAISRAGDVDGDGVVTTKDALMLMQHINGDLILTDDEFKRADLSGNGNLESFEALRILQYINGNINSLAM